MTNEELTIKYTGLDERVTRNEERIKTLYSQGVERSELVKSVQKLAIGVELMAHEQKTLAEKVGSLSKDVNEIKNRPAKRWESVVVTSITIVLTALITFILTQIGLK